MSEHSYQVFPGQAPDEVLTALRELGITRPIEASDFLDESMPPESLRVVLQIGIEHLSRLGGARTGDYVTADVINRGMLAYVRERKARGCE